jgi:hypothetical protein
MSLPPVGSPTIKGFNETYISVYNLILNAEYDVLDVYASATSSDSRELVKQNIISARGTGGFLIHLYGKRRILGVCPASAVKLYLEDNHTSK